MKTNAGYFSEPKTGFHELPVVLMFSLCLAAVLVVTWLLPMRFALAGSAAMTLLGASFFVKDKRMFYLSLITLALVLPTNKRLIEIQNAWPLRMDSIYVSLLDAFLIISYLIWFISSLRGTSSPLAVRKTLVVPFLGLCAACLFSFVNTTQPVWGFFELIRMLKILALYIFLVYNIKNLKDVRTIITFLAVGLLFEFAFCLVEKFVYHGSLGLKYFGESQDSVQSFVADRVVFRTGGTLGHPNGLAFYLDLMAPLMLTRIFTPRTNVWRRGFFLITFAAVCGCLYFTQSRGSIVASGISLTLCFVVIAWRNFRLKYFQIQTLAMAGFALAVLFLFSPKIFDRFEHRDAGAFQTRVDQYHVAFRMFEKHPWMGSGLNSYVLTSPLYDNTASKISTTFPEPVHNMYLLSLAETGVIGLAGLMWMLWSILKIARFWRWPYGDIFDLHLGLFFGLLAFFIHANGEPQALGTSIPLFFMLGLLTAVHQIGFDHLSRAKAVA